MDIDKQEKLKTEAIENLHKSLLDNIDNFDIEIVTDDCIQARYRDRTDGEEIWVDVEINQWDVIKYNCTIVEWSNENEILTPESCHDCDEDCRFYRKSGRCGITDKHVTRELQKWQPTSDIEAKCFAMTLTVGRRAKEESCEVGISHNHLYGVYKIEATTTDVERLLTLIKARSIIFDLYRASKNDVVKY